MQNPSGGTGLSFQAESEYREPTWPERIQGQDKMLHLDIRVDDLDAAVAHALAAGARLADHQPRERVRVLWIPRATRSVCSSTDPYLPECSTRRGDHVQTQTPGRCSAPILGPPCRPSRRGVQT